MITNLRILLIIANCRELSMNTVKAYGFSKFELN